MNLFFIAVILIYALAIGIDTVEHGNIRETRVHVGKTIVGAVVILTLVYFGIITGF